jgi:hypothetical protein
LVTALSVVLSIAVAVSAIALLSHSRQQPQSLARAGDSS